MRANLHRNAPLWDKTRFPRENLESLLELADGFPSPTAVAKDTMHIECGICYAFRYEGQVPDQICGHAKCQRPYHRLCLYEVTSLCFEYRFGTGSGSCIMKDRADIFFLYKFLVAPILTNDSTELPYTLWTVSVLQRGKFHRVYCVVIHQCHFNGFQQQPLNIPFSFFPSFNFQTRLSRQLSQRLDPTGFTGLFHLRRIKKNSALYSLTSSKETRQIVILQEPRHGIEQGAIGAFVVQEFILCDPLPALTFQWFHDLCIQGWRCEAIGQ